MEIKNFILIFIFLLLSSCNSCKIDSSPNYISPGELIDAQWHIVSVTHSNDSTSRYAGTSADSIRFTWHWTSSNFVLDTMFYYINRSVNKYAVLNVLNGPYNNLQPPQATDTLMINPVWHTGYSNYIIVWSLVNNLLVLKIMGATDIETDSLYRGQ